MKKKPNLWVYGFALHLPKPCCIRLCCCSLVTERLCQHSQQVSTSAPLLATEEHPTTKSPIYRRMCLACHVCWLKLLWAPRAAVRGSLKLEQWEVLQLDSPVVRNLLFVPPSALFSKGQPYKVLLSSGKSVSCWGKWELTIRPRFFLLTCCLMDGENRFPAQCCV